ncbi:MAG TPA: helix-turn-helix domain-containing protein [Isosphaeraceae bacterium]|nr:helix-turn-helix domain-containing protein [Isosphaeraceae bacterium]
MKKTSKSVPVSGYYGDVADWSFLTNHARALVFIADNPDARLRDLAPALEVTERTAYGIVADLTAAGYVVKERDGRRNRYHIQDQLTLRDSVTRERTIGEVLDLLAARPRRARKGSRAPRSE